MSKVEELHKLLGEAKYELEAQTTEGWKTPGNRTTQEYNVRQTLYALSELEHRLEELQGVSYRLDDPPYRVVT